MTDKLIQIKSFLGKYYANLAASANSEKYSDTKLSKFFEQRFYIQGNKPSIIIDPTLKGLVLILAGNEVHVSEQLSNHPNIKFINTRDTDMSRGNPQELFSDEVFQTVSYLICTNHTFINIDGDVDEPIYIRHRADFETFFCDVVVVSVAEGVSVEVVEEIDSMGALSAVMNYVIGTNATLDLTTFYNNSNTAQSFVYRNIVAREHSKYTHILLGKGCTTAIDENKIYAHEGSVSELLGCIDSNERNFHTIMYVQPTSLDYSIDVTYRNILYGKHNVTFFPVLLSDINADNATIDTASVHTDNKDDLNNTAIVDFIKDIIDRVKLERMTGVTRFYNNKSKFLLSYK